MSRIKMARQNDPRAEALAVSRIRGNSLRRDEQENFPPKDAPKPFSALKASFEDLSKNPESHHSTRRNFGSKVGRLKSMFQSGHVGKTEKGGEDLLKSPPSPGGAQNIPHIELDRSPEVKRKKTSEPHSHTSAGLPLDRSPTRQESRLLETASHVERFNHTRAMFARMEEQNRQDSERQARLRYRKHSPGGTSSSTSPALSPISSTPTSPDGRKRSPSRDRIGKSASHESLGKPRSSSDPTRVNKISYRSNTDPTQQRPRSENFDQVNVSGIHSRSEGNLRGGNFPNAPGGLLYKRRSQEDEILEELRRDAERNGEHQLSDWSEKDVREYSSHSNSRSSSRKEEAMDTGGDNCLYDDVQYNNQYSQDSNANQGRRSRRDHYISSTYQHKHSQQQQQPSAVAESRDDRDSEVVMRRKNQGEYQAHVSAGKRLSKEEIQAAIDRADVYLSHVSSPETTPERKPEKSKRWSQEQHVSPSEDQTDSAGEVREWTKYKSQRHSRGSDHLDNKVADFSKLDEIASVSSIASYKKARAEKSPSPSPVPSPASPSSMSDSEKSSHSQSTTKVYVELKKGEPSTPPNLNVPTRPPRGVRRSSPGPPLPAKPAHLINSSYKTSVVDPEDGLTQITNRLRPKAVYLTETSSKADIPPPPSYSVATASIAKTTTDSSRPMWDDDAPDSHGHAPLLTKDSSDILLSPSETVSPAHVISVEEEMTEEEAEVLLSKRRDLLTDAEAQEVEGLLLAKREDGDGHEEPDKVLHSDPSGDQPLEMIEVEYGFAEVEGLGSTDDEDDDANIVKKVGRVKFSRNPIKVFCTYSGEEYDRRNEDIDPVAASAEYELEKRVEKMEVFPVDLEKGPEGLGLSIIGMGVGADSGLEKLGIFIKTLTAGGAAQRDARIEVNDQIIEVDGKSLVGVTQAYAASVLRNTSGKVQFLIGREKNPEQSEVARLIQQSLEQDRRREELRRQESERLHKMQEALKQKGTALGEQSQDEDSEDDEDMDDDDKVGHYTLNASASEEEEEGEELAAGETTPLQMPASVDEETVGSPEGSPAKSSIEVFDLADSSSESGSPDMDSQAMFVKLKEAQYKNAVSDAEIAKLKAKMILLENVEAQKKDYEKKCEDMAQRLLETEKALEAARKEINGYQDMLEGSQGQYISLEKRMQGEYSGLEKKYHKAKKLIKEYQQREKDFIQERESLLQQQSERDHQYNALVKSLKDRIFQLEHDLAEAQKAAGLPVLIPKDTPLKTDLPARKSPTQSAKNNSRKDSTNGSAKTGERLSDGSSESDMSSPELTTSPDGDVMISSIERSQEGIDSFTEVPETVLLDTSVGKSKAQLASAGGLSSRRPPSKRSHDQESDGEAPVDVDSKFENESSSETWIKHDGLPESEQIDSTVRKNDAKKKRLPLADCEIVASRSANQESAVPPPPSAAPVSEAVTSATVSEQAKAAPVKLLSAPEADSTSEQSLSRHGSQSDSASTVSQHSYDPSKPTFKGMAGEIPETSSTGTSESSSSAKLSGKRGVPGFKPPKLPSRPPRGGGGDGIVLLSRRPLGSKGGGGEGGGITLLSSRPLDTGYSPHISSRASLHEEEATSSMMLPDYEDEGKSTMMYTVNQAAPSVGTDDSAMNKRDNQFQSCAITEWSVEHVCHWLMALELDQYSSEFRDKNVTGMQLLQLDGSKLKSLGVGDGNDRALIKKKIKEMKTAIEKERKQQEKEKKAKEKEQGKRKLFAKRK